MTTKSNGVYHGSDGLVEAVTGSVPPVRKHDIHPGGAKRLSTLVDDYVLTMQHALRQDLRSELISRAKDEAGVLPEFSPAEMYDYLVDTDDEFFNWCFPFCAIRLTKSNLGYLHTRILSDFRKSLQENGSQNGSLTIKDK